MKDSRGQRGGVAEGKGLLAGGRQQPQWGAEDTTQQAQPGGQGLSLTPLPKKCLMLVHWRQRWAHFTIPNYKCPFQSPSRRPSLYPGLRNLPLRTEESAPFPVLATPSMVLPVRGQRPEKKISIKWGPMCHNQSSFLLSLESPGLFEELGLSEESAQAEAKGLTVRAPRATYSAEPIAPAPPPRKSSYDI